MIAGEPRRDGDPADADKTPLRRLPLWLQPWAVILNFFGTPLMFVFLLVAQDAGYIPSRSRDTVEALNAHTVATSAAASQAIAVNKALADSLTQVREQLERSNRVIRVICADRGRDPDVRNACLWGTGP